MLKLQAGFIYQNHSQAEKFLNIVQSEILTAYFGSLNSDQEFYPNWNLLMSMENTIVK